MLDEVDLLLKKKESKLIRNCIQFFTEGNLKNSLRGGKYKEISEALRAVRYRESELSSTNLAQNEANRVVRFAAGMGAQIEDHKLQLYGVCFSWKAKLRGLGRNVIGFSGTLDPHFWSDLCSFL